MNQLGGFQSMVGSLILIPILSLLRCIKTYLWKPSIIPLVLWLFLPSLLPSKTLSNGKITINMKKCSSRSLISIQRIWWLATVWSINQIKSLKLSHYQIISILICWIVLKKHQYWQLLSQRESIYGGLIQVQ